MTAPPLPETEPAVREGTSRPAYDLVVIGGGIHGCGIARDAALRGLRVALFERDDFACGTSGASSKLAHGGLRYLEQLRLGLVRESLRERSALLKIAPHLVRPLPFLVPVYENAPRSKWLLRAGLTLYDLLALGHSLGRHRWMSAEEAVSREPRLRPEGLKGAFEYHDAQMDDARLCIENALDAAAQGAHVRNRQEVVDLVVHEGHVRGVRVLDRLSGATTEVESRLVVDTTGPWYGELQARQSLATTTRPRLSRGTHVVVPRITSGHALLLSARRDGRVFFVIPFKGRTLIGTTDLEHHGPPESAAPTEEEIGYLLDESNAVLAGDDLLRSDVAFAFAGVRALTPDEERNLGSVSRQAEVREEAPGLLGVLGGKYTTYRVVAEDVVDRVLNRLGGPKRPCVTASRVLPGGNVPAMNDYFAVAEDLLREKYDTLPAECLRYLLGTYGSRHTDILSILDSDPEAGELIEPGYPFTLAEVEHAVRNEMAHSLDDVLRRRCYRAYLGDWVDDSLLRWTTAFDRARRRVRGET